MTTLSASNDGADREDLGRRVQRAAYMTRMAELDLFEQILRKASDTSMTVKALDGLTPDDRARLATVQGKLARSESPDAMERVLLEKATRISEQVGKTISRRTLRSARDSNAQLLLIMAHSPSYSHDERMKALKQLEDMRASDPTLTAVDIEDILAMPLADAYHRVAELSLLGSLTKEQADQTMRALDHRNEARLRDLASKHQQPPPPPPPAGALPSPTTDDRYEG